MKYISNILKIFFSYEIENRDSRTLQDKKLREQYPSTLQCIRILRDAECRTVRNQEQKIIFLQRRQQGLI